MNKMKKILSGFTGEKKYRILLTVGYILLLSPFVYSVFYSMPANDDFAWALEWWSSNRLVETFHRIGWNYMNFFGQSGVFAIFVQILINPLYLFNNAGHSFGICMVIVFLFIAAGIIIALKRLVINMIGNASDTLAETVAFLVMTILYTSYYYNDVYNWWSGVPGYSLMMMLELFTLNAIIVYANNPTKKNFITVIILGIISCSGMMYCVVTGVFYVLYVYFFRLKNGESFIKKTIPLILFILSGVITMIAPGNFNRMGETGVANASVKASVIVTVFRVIFRTRASLISKPILLLVLLILLFLGIKYKSQVKIGLWQLILSMFAIMFSVFGAVLPYVYGSNKAIDSEFAARIFYIEDYLTFIGIALWVFMLGCYIGNKLSIKFKRVAFAAAVGISTFVCILYGNRHGYLTQILQYDILQKADLIKESYYFWDDILDEIESAADGSDVVVNRKDVDWCPYVYDTSMDGDYKDPVAEGYMYGNCNQCGSLYYGVHSIVVNLE